MFKKQNEEKNKVGRPKLADSKLKKESIIVSCIVIFTAILLTIFGGMELVSMSGINLYTDKLQGNVDLNKLSGKTLDCSSGNICDGFDNSKASWDWVNRKVRIPLYIRCNTNYNYKLKSVSINSSGTTIWTGNQTCGNNTSTVYVDIPISTISSGGRKKYHLVFNRIKKNGETSNKKNDEYDSITFKLFNNPSITANGSVASDKKSYNLTATLKYDGAYLKPTIKSDSASCEHKKGSASSSTKASTTYTYSCKKNGKVVFALVTKNGGQTVETKTYTVSGISTSATTKKKTTKKTVNNNVITFSCNTSKTKVNTKFKCTSNVASTYALSGASNSCKKSISSDKKTVTVSCSKTGTAIITAYGENGKKSPDRAIKIEKASNTTKKTTTKKKTTAKKTTKKKNVVKKATKKKTTTKKISCNITVSDIDDTSAKYKVQCNTATKITKQSIADGKFKTAVNKNKKVKLHSSTITGLKPKKKYTLKVTANGKTISKSFTTNDQKAEDKLASRKKYDGGCGTISVEPVLAKNSKTAYDPYKVKIKYKPTLAVDKNYTSVNSILNNTDLLYKTYKKSTNKYTIKKGQAKQDTKYGVLSSGTSYKITSKWKKDSTGFYYKTFTIGDGKTKPGFLYATIYIGSTKCHPMYIVKDGITLDNSHRRFNLSHYYIATNKGVLKGNISTVTSSDNKVFAVNNSNKNNSAISLKATSQYAKSGKEAAKDKTATITFSRTGLSYTGKFKIMLPDRYWETAYLSNPISASRSGKLSATSMYSGSYNKTSKTKNYKLNNKHVNGMELKVSSGAKIHAMDSGTVTSVISSQKNTNVKIIQIRSTVSGRDYIHTYGNLKTVSIKKGDRVYKNQTIGTAKGKYLYISLTYRSGSSYIYMLPSNFIGKNVSYADVTSSSLAKTCQKYSENCVGKTSVTTNSTTKSTVGATTTSKQNTVTSNKTSSSSTVTTKTTTSVMASCKINYADRKVGDVNCDGVVSNSDTVKLYGYIRGTIKITDSDTLKISDVNGDGVISISDVAKLHMFNMNKINKICDATGKKCLTK